MKARISATGTAVASASRRPWYSVAFLQAAVADHHAVRHADQFPVGKHRRALAAVVEDHVDAGGLARRSCSAAS
jgi:hypothetical protein